MQTARRAGLVAAAMLAGGEALAQVPPGVPNTFEQKAGYPVWSCILFSVVALFALAMIFRGVRTR
jgi:hypothetical protein